MTSAANEHQMVPRIARLHELIEALRVRAPRLVKGDDLAAHLSVTVRTVERDVAKLRAAGVPIVVRRGRAGGYGIDARSYLPPLKFTPGEAAALVTVVAAVGPHVSASAHTAMVKLLDALRTSPGHQRAQPDGDVPLRSAP